MSDVNRFFQCVYGDKPEKSYILVWTLKNKLSRWFQEVHKAVHYANTFGIDDIYVGVGLAPRSYGEKFRCKAANICAIPGFAVDIDVAGPGHKGKNYPPSIEDALALVQNHGWDPTLVVHSGHGLQAWWLFKEVWEFDTPEEREKAALFARRINDTVRARAREKGWTIDSTFDLARVLRIPGTWNNKTTPVQAKILLLEKRRKYNPEDLEELLLPEVPPPAKNLPTGKDTTLKGITLSPNAEAPLDKLVALIDIEPKFKAAWDNRRPDLKSASEVDLSIASFAAGAGWSQQEIANLIIHWRRRTGETPEKALRADYINGILEVVKDRAETAAAEEKLQDELLTVNSHDMTPERRANILQTISTRLGITINRVVKYKESPPKFKIFTDKGEVFLGEAGNLLEQRPFRLKLAAETRHLLRKLKGEQWEPVAQSFCCVWEEEEVSPESTESGRLRCWLVDYLSDKQPNPQESCAETGEPIFEPYEKEGFTDPVWHISIQEFKKFLMFHKNERSINEQNLLRTLKGLGCRRTRFKTKGNSTKRYWAIPAYITNSDTEE